MSFGGALVVWGREGWWGTVVCSRLAGESHVATTVVGTIGTAHLTLSTVWLLHDWATVWGVGPGALIGTVGAHRCHWATIAVIIWRAHHLVVWTSHVSANVGAISSWSGHGVGNAVSDWGTGIVGTTHWGAEHILRSTLGLNCTTIGIERPWALESLAGAHWGG